MSDLPKIIAVHDWKLGTVNKLVDEQEFMRRIKHIYPKDKLSWEEDIVIHRLLCFNERKEVIGSIALVDMEKKHD